MPNELLRVRAARRAARQRRDLARAEAALARRRRRLAFGSVRAALRWYGEARPRMGSAHGLHPRTEPTDDFGGRAPVAVDGGPQADLDELLATLATISDALDRLRVYDPALHQVAILVATGHSQADIGRRIGFSQRIVSAMLARAEAFLAALIGGPDGVLRGRG